MNKIGNNSNSSNDNSNNSKNKNNSSNNNKNNSKHGSNHNDDNKSKQTKQLMKQSFVLLIYYKQDSSHSFRLFTKNVANSTLFFLVRN